jgi:hypothetical protein
MIKKSSTKVPKVTPQVKLDDPQDARLLEIMGKYNNSMDYIRKGYKTKWDVCRNLYNGNRTEANYEGNSNTFVPETFSIIQSIKSNVAGGKIAIDYYPTEKSQKGDTDTLKSLMDQIWVQDRTKLKSSWAIDDSLQVGNGYLWQHWNGSYPCNTYVPTEDNWFDVEATNYENLQFGGYRFLATKEELEAETKTNVDYDPEDPKSKRT